MAKSDIDSPIILDKDFNENIQAPCSSENVEPVAENVEIEKCYTMEDVKHHCLEDSIWCVIGDGV